MSDKREIFLDMVKQYCKEDIPSITPELRFREDLGFDSLTFMSFLGEVEDQFDVELDEQKAVKLVTVADALEYLDELT